MPIENPQASDRHRFQISATDIHDLLLVDLIAVGACLVLLVPELATTAFRPVFGLLLVLFLPGWMATLAAFPRTSSTTKPRGHETGGSGGFVTMRGEQSITLFERGILAIIATIALDILAGVVLSVTAVGVHPQTLAVVLAAVTLWSSLVVIVRRSKLPTEQRFVFRPAAGVGRAKQFLRPTGMGRAVMNLVLIASLLVASGTVAYAFVHPNRPGPYTEFYLLSTNERGQYVMGEYPTEFTAGEAKPVYIGLGNHEHQTEAYTVIVELERGDRSAASNQVRERQELARFQLTLEDGASAKQKVSISPIMAGDSLQLIYLLYKSPPPANPTNGNAYRALHMTINVTQPSASMETSANASSIRWEDRVRPVQRATVEA